MLDKNIMPPESDLEEKSRVEDEIGMARQKCIMEGASGGATNQLDGILTDYLNGDLGADEAVSKAKKISGQ